MKRFRVERLLSFSSIHSSGDPSDISVEKRKKILADRFLEHFHLEWGFNDSEMND